MLTRFFTTKELLILVGVASAIFVGGTMAYVAKKHPAAASVQAEQRADPKSDTNHQKKAGGKPELASTKGELPTSPGSSASLVVTPNPKSIPPVILKKIVVAVGGAVDSPGSYTLTESDRVEDLIKKAHGLTEAADASDINMAAPLIDGATLTIPFARVKSSDGGHLVIRSGATAAALNPPEYTISGWQIKSKTSSGSRSSSQTKGATAASTPSGPVDLNRATQEELESLPGVGPKLAQQIISYRAQQPFTSVDDLQNVPGIGAKKLDAVRAFVTVGQ